MASVSLLFDLLAVWEKDERKWYLLQLARFQSAIASSTNETAIALARKNSHKRLVFLTKLNKKRRRKNTLI